MASSPSTSCGLAFQMQSERLSHGRFMISSGSAACRRACIAPGTRPCWTFSCTTNSSLYASLTWLSLSSAAQKLPMQSGGATKTKAALLKGRVGDLGLCFIWKHWSLLMPVTAGQHACFLGIDARGCFGSPICVGSIAVFCYLELEYRICPCLLVELPCIKQCSIVHAEVGSC